LRLLDIDYCILVFIALALKSSFEALKARYCPTASSCGSMTIEIDDILDRLNKA
jgi:hypothetical protein